MTTRQEARGWLEANLEDPEFRRLYEREGVAEQFIAQVETHRAAQKLSRSDLARRMDCKPANITRIMRRTSNLTLDTLVDLALAVSCRVRILLEPIAIREAWSLSSGWIPGSSAADVMVEGHLQKEEAAQGGAATLTTLPESVGKVTARPVFA